MLILSVDGNIGSGKSTLVTELESQFPHVVFLQEPVEIWQKINLLDLFYQNKKRWAYTFQNFAYITRLRVLKEAIENNPPDTIFITERSILTDRHVFAELLKRENYMNEMEWKCYLEWFKFLEIPIQGIIYVNTTVSNCCKRINKRGRIEESKIPTRYLEQLDKQHKKWLSKTEIPIITVDGNIDNQREENYYQIIGTKLQEFILSLQATSSKRF